MDALSAAQPKRRRISGKTAPPAYAAADVAGEEQPNVKREVYLVTLPHPRIARSQGVLLRAPGDLTREEVAAAVRLACAQPLPEAAGQHQWQFQPGPVPVKKLAVFRELHQPGADGRRAAHYHVAVHLGRQVKFAAFKRALLVHSGLVSNWGCTHTGYWSAVRYGVRATPKKPLHELDGQPYAWAADGKHPRLQDAAQEPTTAAALEARRWAATQRASQAGGREPRIEEVDVWPLVIRSGARNTPDDPFGKQRLIQWAKENCSQREIAWLYKNRSRLNSIIDDAWEWEEVDGFLADVGQERFARFLDARSWPCVCEGRWVQHVQQSFLLNRVDVRELCQHVVSSLRVGRSEETLVVTLLGRFGGEGKSLFFAPLAELYGEGLVQRRPAGGQFPLLGIHEKKVSILDEWSFSDDDLPMGLQLLWYEGKGVPVSRPQNVPGQSGHSMYKGSAPVFVTAPETAVTRLCAAAAGAPTGEACMLLRRLKLFVFTVPIPAPAAPRIKPCPRCFARFVTEAAGGVA